VLLAGATTMLSWPDAPDWSDHEAVAELESARADILGDDPVAARANAAHIWDRTPGTHPRFRWATRWAWCSLNRRTSLGQQLEDQ
jgi:uncharacterized protein YraI